MGISASAASAMHQQHEPIRSISISAASAHQQHQCISSIITSAASASAVSAHQQHKRISSINSISASAASVHQQHQRISSISSSSASAASVHQQHQHISYIHWMGYLPIYINSGHISLYTLTPPDMLRHHQTCSRHHQTCTRHHQIPPDMRHIYYKYWHQCSKSIYIGINADVTDAGRTGRDK